MSNLTITSNQGENLLQYLLKVSIKHHSVLRQDIEPQSTP